MSTHSLWAQVKENISSDIVIWFWSRSCTNPSRKCGVLEAGNGCWVDAAHVCLCAPEALFCYRPAWCCRAVVCKAMGVSFVTLHEWSLPGTEHSHLTDCRPGTDGSLAYTWICLWAFQTPWFVWVLCFVGFFLSLFALGVLFVLIFLFCFCFNL